MTRRQLVLGAGAAAFAGPVWLDRASAVSTSEAGTPYEPEIDPASFTTTIDNRYLPMLPGMVLYYESAEDDTRQRNIVAVTSETRTVMGVECVVVQGTVFEGAELLEDTQDWYAQDRDGNVWYFGEDTREYKNGEIDNREGSWEAGTDGAQPGIIMPANPKVGETYRQEFYEGEAEDMAEVLKLGEHLDVAFTSFDDVLVTREWTPLEPDIEEHKSYAPGVGLIREQRIKGGTELSDLVWMQAGAALIATPES